MRKLLILLLLGTSFLSLAANEKIKPSNLSFDFTTKQSLQGKVSDEFEITNRLINYNRCNTTGIFLLSYSVPAFLWFVASSSVFSELKERFDPNASAWGTVSFTSGILCSGLLCSGLTLLIFGAVKYHRYKKWGNAAALYDVFFSGQRLFSYFAVGGGIAAGVGTAGLISNGAVMLFYPQIISSYIFCGLLIASAAVLTLSLPLMIASLSLRSWLKKECRRLSLSMIIPESDDFSLSVSIPIEAIPQRK